MATMPYSGTLSIAAGAYHTASFATAGYSRFGYIVPPSVQGTWLLVAVSPDNTHWAILGSVNAMSLTQEVNVAKTLEADFTVWPYLSLWTVDATNNPVNQAAACSIFFVAV